LKALDVLAPYSEIIPDFSDFLDSLQGDPPTGLRVNTLLASPQEVARSLRSRGVRLAATPLGETFWTAQGLRHPGHLLEHLMGLIYVQAVSAGLAALVLAPGPGQWALDLCAAPGGKTTHMAQLMENRGWIIANEPHPERRGALQSNLRRLGVTNALVSAYPGQSFPRRWRFQRVLVDAPCSGTGNGRIGLRGELRGAGAPSGHYTVQQRALLLRGFDLLSEEGTLLYATCTYDPEENEGVLHHLLCQRPARVLPIALSIPHDPGVTSWKGEAYHDEVVHAWRIYPHRIPSVGFFLAKIGRR
jgi:NOL1/NOP2/sun family putative RNA methylase